MSEQEMDSLKLGSPSGAQVALHIDIITVLPELLESPLSHSIMKRAQDKGLLEVYTHNLRQWAVNDYNARQRQDIVFKKKRLGVLGGKDKHKMAGRTKYDALNMDIFYIFQWPNKISLFVSFGA